VNANETRSGLLVALVATAAMTPLLLAARWLPEKRAVTAEPPKPPEVFDVAKVDAYVAGQLAPKGFVGLSLAIVRDGAIVLAKGYGLASRETKSPVDVDTAFAVGSVTKQLTCAGALILAEEGKLSLDDKVAKYFPDLAGASDITLDDVGGHISGYPDYYPLDFLDARFQKATSPDDLLRRYAVTKLDFEPRSRWSYSNTGFVILGRAVEKAAGQPLGAVLSERIFEPLGMTHASYDPKAGAPGLAQGYMSFALGDSEPAEREAEGWGGGAFGVFASATDLAKWDLGLMKGKVLKPESFVRMTTSHVLADGRKTGYGCGLRITTLQNETILVHEGEVNGFIAINAMIPRLEAAVVVLSNDDADPRPLYREILKLLVQDERRVPKIEGPPAADVARTLFADMQRGALDRSKLGEDFGRFVGDDRTQAAASRLRALGEPTSVEVQSTSERGGMEVSVVAFTFKTAKVTALMFRSRDGKVQEFLLTKES
jgi:D-alanyl-D-alanine carboxypeptidase